MLIVRNAGAIFDYNNILAINVNNCDTIVIFKRDDKFHLATEIKYQVSATHSSTRHYIIASSDEFKNCERLFDLIVVAFKNGKQVFDLRSDLADEPELQASLTSSPTYATTD